MCNTTRRKPAKRATAAYATALLSRRKMCSIDGRAVARCSGLRGRSLFLPRARGLALGVQHDTAQARKAGDSRIRNRATLPTQDVFNRRRAVARCSGLRALAVPTQGSRTRPGLHAIARFAGYCIRSLLNSRPSYATPAADHWLGQGRSQQRSVCPTKRCAAKNRHRPNTRTGGLESQTSLDQATAARRVALTYKAVQTAAVGAHRAAILLNARPTSAPAA